MPLQRMICCSSATHVRWVCAHVRHNAIIPYTQPLGSDGQLPLLSANADGIHATDDREGPKVLDSTFFNLGALFPPKLLHAA